MAFKGGADEQPGSSARRSAVYHGNNHPRNPEEDFCTQHSMSGANAIPPYRGLSKRVRQPRSTPPYGGSQRESGNRGPPGRMAPTAQRRKLASQHSMPGWHATPPCRIALPAARSLGEQRSTAYHKLSTLSPISLHYPSNKQPEPARGEFRLLL